MHKHANTQWRLPALASAMLLAGLLLSACAPIPTLPEAASPCQADTLGLAAEGTELHSQWWRDYGDERLNALVERALSDAPNIALARARLARALAGVDGAAAADKPLIGLGADLTRQRYSENGLFPPPLAGSVRDSATIRAQISYEWDFFGRHAAELQAALGQRRAAEAEQAAAALGLSAAVTRSYLALAHLQSQEKLLEQQLALREQSLALVRQRVAAGLDDKQPLRQAEAPLDELKRQRLALALQVQQQRHALAALTAQPQAALADLNARLPETLNWQQAPHADLLGRRPDIVAARWRVEASVEDVKVARSQFYPNVSLTAFGGLDAIGTDRLFKGGSRDFGFGPSLRLPLFDTGRLRAQLRGSAAQQQAAVAAYDAVVIDAVREAADQLSALQSLQQQRQTQQQLLANAAQQTQLLEQRAAAGLGNQLPVLGARQAQLSQQRQALELQAQALDAQVRLMQALGGGYQADDSTSAKR
ncbi:efflux transporter outer membrane subunit [Paucibacter sp. APW11]|uniref:Efflux transporter outer membrane subunit n=1 Tax=Roseateles aquae TaxID=3077235 RepID=A0ABU3PAC9_9BURK|nr:efflux transporter outer membrane subunit [Paucibacter sp. APW11]MDT8998696.1 efflux transporter outer membrane subunit [Paucibacter sp. APW11]